MFQLVEKPLVYLGEFVYALHAHAVKERFFDDQQPLVGGRSERSFDVLYLHFAGAHKTMQPLSYHSDAFLNGFLKGASDGHHLADALHRRTELAVYATEFA